MKPEGGDGWKGNFAVHSICDPTLEALSPSTHLGTEALCMMQGVEVRQSICIL